MSRPVFYYNLYRRNENVRFSMEREINEPYLDEEGRMSCEAPLTVDELFDAVMTLRSGKTPGCDGLTIEFYRKFFKILSPFMIRMYQFAFTNRMLPLSARRGLISLLPKGQKDTRYVKNMRPIMILCNDYKILAKAMDNRLRLVIEKLIDPSQTGFVKGRIISDNIRKSLDIIEFCKVTQKPAIILSIDMEKCFDKLNHQAIKASLAYFGFGPIFTQWISIFFEKFEFCTQNMGFTSNFYKKEQGVNQGCPISPSLFLLSGAILSNKLKNNRLIHGIKVGDTEILISQFADDMDLYLKYDKTVLEEVIRTFHILEKNTGLKVSYEKTTIYRIGSLANTDAKIYTSKNFRWANDYIETLGINISNDPETLRNNFNVVLRKLEAISNIWYYRQLTLSGRILIINTLFSSKFVYKMQVLHHISDDQIRRAEEIITSFLWKGRKAKISMKILKMNKDQGGMGLVDLKAKHQSLQIAWIKKIHTNPEVESLACFFLGRDYILNDSLWKANMCESDARKIGKAGFWQNLLCTWARFNFHDPQSRDSVVGQLLWNNSHIKHNVGRGRQKTLSDQGLMRIYDLLDTEYVFMTRDRTNSKIGCNLSVMEYNSLVTAIPAHWKSFLRSPVFIDQNKDKWEIIERNKKVSSIVYHELISDDYAITHSGKQWQAKLGPNFDRLIHEKSFRNIRTVTNITKYRDFQFRLLHNKIFCNDVLFHWGIKDSQQCDYCPEKQTVTHLFYDCTQIRDFWFKLYMYLSERTEDQLVLSIPNVIYNLVHPKAGHIVNFIVLTAKILYFQKQN